MNIGSVSSVNFAGDFARKGKWDAGAATAPKQASTAKKVATGVAVAAAATAITLGVLSSKGKLANAPKFVQTVGEKVATFGKFVFGKVKDAADWVKTKATGIVNTVKAKFAKPAAAAAEAAAS